MAKGLKVRTQVKGGGWSLNHSRSEALRLRDRAKAGAKAAMLPIANRRMRRGIALASTALAVLVSTVTPASAAPSANLVQGNFIGTDVTGAASAEVGLSIEFATSSSVEGRPKFRPAILSGEPVM